jgi:prepilin-type N-terminal cleavage/methylation domain-containing protein
MKRYRIAQGFTIVELLIVVVIIAIISSIAIVAYSGIQSRARESKDRDAANSITQYLETYSVVNGGLPTAAQLADPTWRSQNSLNDGLLKDSHGLRVAGIDAADPAPSTHMSLLIAQDYWTGQTCAAILQTRSEVTGVTTNRYINNCASSWAQFSDMPAQDACPASFTYMGGLTSYTMDAVTHFCAASGAVAF